MAGRRTGLLASGVVGRAFPGLRVAPVAGALAPAASFPGHSGGTAPALHRTSLDHRPIYSGESNRSRRQPPHTPICAEYSAVPGREAARMRDSIGKREARRACERWREQR
jgi:hypothetical protein